MPLKSIEYIFLLFELKLFFAIAKGFLLSNSKSLLSTSSPLLSNSKSLLSTFSPLLSNSKSLLSIFFPLLLKLFPVEVKGQRAGPQLRGVWNHEWKASPHRVAMFTKNELSGAIFLIYKVQQYMNLSIRWILWRID